ncbi:MAG: DUF885 family protein [Elusimicrobiota bacterium]
MKRPPARTAILECADSYFGPLARSFPVQCASDEFLNFPRASRAVRYMDRLDDLDQDAVSGHVRRVKGIVARLSELPCDDIEDEIDVEMLTRSAYRLLSELEADAVHRHEPQLYLRIALIGVNHTLYKRASRGGEREEWIARRLSGIPRLLRQGGANLRSAPDAAKAATLEMIEQCSGFFRRDLLRHLEMSHPDRRGWGKLARAALEALDEYRSRVKSLPPGSRRPDATSVLNGLLRRSYGCRRTPKEIFELAREEERRVLKSLKKTARSIDPSRSWVELSAEVDPGVGSPKGLLRLYRDETASLRAFFRGLGMRHLLSGPAVSVAETPRYLNALRVAASYNSPLSRHPEEPAYFYIAPTDPSWSPRARRENIRRVHNEYVFTSAHETYPGHHSLDSLRLRHRNPVRRQIESPFFYEGWSCYAERWIDDLGYLRDPRQRLLLLKRALWRAHRAMIDVGLGTGRLDVGGACSLLAKLGFGRKDVLKQVRRYSLTRGYQLCYFLGGYEILRLRSRFQGKLGARRFHKALLDGGQIPFARVGQRMRSLLNSRAT